MNNEKGDNDLEAIIESLTQRVKELEEIKKIIEKNKKGQVKLALFLNSLSYNKTYEAQDSNNPNCW